jgi:UDP-3-O-[3-hydroxymyristoyl] glucosamine N-acyltransferase
MRKRQFHRQPKGLTVAEIATLTGAVPLPGAPLDRLISDVNSLDRAWPSDLVFIDSAKYAGELPQTRAGACLITERFEAGAPAGVALLRSSEPFQAFVAVGRALYPDALRPSSLYEVEGRAPEAVVHPSARIEYGVTIEPGAVIGPRAGIGSGTVICSTAVIGADVQIGRDCSVGPGATVMHALIGDSVVLHPGCRIGQDGFRYQPGPKGHIKVPQLGRVIIQDHVEIGAGAAIDRGGYADTVIGEGTKIDNLVQIGHNCMVGRHCIIVAECGLSGSVVLGDHVVLGGQVGIADHVTIGEGAMVAAKSGVMSNIPPGEAWMGYPAVPRRRFLRDLATARRAGKSE